MSTTPKKCTINAAIVGVEIDENKVIAIGFSEDDSYERMMVITYSEEQSQEDMKHNWSKYHVTLGSEGAGAYNCISEVTIFINSIHFALNDIGKAVFLFDLIMIEVGFEQIYEHELIKILKKVFLYDGVSVNDLTKSV